jgi:DNA-binding transcriptional MerR regulator
MAKIASNVRHLPLAADLGRAAPEWVAPTDERAAPADERDERSDEADKLFQVGDIAKATGKTVRAIHHYEELGLLRPHARSKGRYRLYDASALVRVRWIGKLHDLGLSLAEIQQMVSTWESSPSAPGAMSQMRRLYEQKLEDTRAQIARLATLERELVASLDYLDTCDTCCDPAELVAACADCNHHGEERAEPELVAGIHLRFDGAANGSKPRPVVAGCSDGTTFGPGLRVSGAADPAE